MQYFYSEDFGINDLPQSGYSYIYIYKRENIVLYVGQTSQSVQKRYFQHQSDTSGARYANKVLCLQVLSEYTDFVEGFLGKELDGICQGAFPNPEKALPHIPVKFLRELKKIKAILLEDSILSHIPVMQFSLPYEGSVDTLRLLAQIAKEHTILWDNYKGKEQKSLTIFCHHLVEDSLSCYLLIAPNAGYRPMCLFEVQSTTELKKVLAMNSDLPVYGIIDREYYSRYKEHLDGLLRGKNTGIILSDKSEFSLLKPYLKNRHPKRERSARLASHFPESTCRIHKTPYNTFRCL